MISKKIAEIFDIKNGYTPSKAKSEYWTNGIIPWFRMDDLRENGFILSKSKKLITKEAIKGKIFEANSIILATTATIGVHALITSNFLCNQQFTNFCLKEEYKTKFNIKFLYYYFFKIDEWCIKNTVSSAFPSVQINKLKLLQIPIPPIEIQNKIVEILDKFTNYKAELKAELTFRKEQYKYYRDKLLNNFNLNSKLARVGDVCLLKRGEVISKIFINNNKGIFPVYSSQTNNNGEIGKINSYKYNGEYLTWTTDGAYAGTVFYRKGKFNITNVCGLLENKDPNKLNIKYLYYILHKYAPLYVNRNTSNPKLMSNVMSDIKIPIPPIEVQNKIVEILDKFSSLISTISEGLPKEIELRNKQYEYYRDLLLDFEDK